MKTLERITWGRASSLLGCAAVAVGCSAPGHSLGEVGAENPGSGGGSSSGTSSTFEDGGPPGPGTGRGGTTGSSTGGGSAGVVGAGGRGAAGRGTGGYRTGRAPSADDGGIVVGKGGVVGYDGGVVGAGGGVVGDDGGPPFSPYRCFATDANGLAHVSWSEYGLDPLTGTKRSTLIARLSCTPMESELPARGLMDLIRISGCGFDSFYYTHDPLYSSLLAEGVIYGAESDTPIGKYMRGIPSPNCPLLNELEIGAGRPPACDETVSYSCTITSPSGSDDGGVFSR